MPITVNEGGVLYELETVTSNESGVLYELDTVHANEGGTLREIHSGLPTSLTWTCDTSKDSTAKLNLVSEDGLTVTYTSANANWSAAPGAIYSNTFTLPAGAVIKCSFSNAIGGFSSRVYGMMVFKGNEIADGGVTTYTTETAGQYRIGLRAHGINGSQQGVSYTACTVTVKISITK